MLQTGLLDANMLLADLQKVCQKWCCLIQFCHVTIFLEVVRLSGINFVEQVILLLFYDNLQNKINIFLEVGCSCFLLTSAKILSSHVWDDIISATFFRSFWWRRGIELRWWQCLAHLVLLPVISVNADSNPHVLCHSLKHVHKKACIHIYCMDGCSDITLMYLKHN